MPTYVKVSGVWKLATVFVKVGGAWKSANPSPKVGGAWKSVGGNSITIPSNWGYIVGGAIITATAKTLTVPGGNPGNITMAPNVTSGAPTIQYQKNGGAWTGMPGSPVNFANGDTLNFRALCSSGDAGSVDAIDTSTAASIGSFGFSRP